MKVFLLDVLHDLRSKRVWPIAAVLLVAIVAVPVVLLQAGAEVPAPAPEPAPGPSTKALPTEVKLSKAPEGGTSRLNQFQSHNPFRPKQQKPAEDATTTGGGGDSGSGSGEPSSPPASGAQTGGTTPSDGSSQATSPGKSPAGGENGSSSGGGSGSKSSGGSTATTTGSTTVEPASAGSNKVKTPKLSLLSYEATVAYGPAGQVNPRKVRALDVFPDKRRLFMFSGVSKDGRDAIFTVLDPSLVSERGGDGHCVQVAGRCAVLHLRDGQERRFKNARGDTYVIRLGSLDVVKKVVGDLTGKLSDTIDKLLDPLKR